ncbi:TetR/AcrR family transcriptional regulator [Furfurilactobacillus entadae]|uniref:TetR/AcrR family transcriptional regulator n=1 Tax=Furfurilactobacillus entadae TaxID=2922307 RepID=UPI0035E5FF73
MTKQYLRSQRTKRRIEQSLLKLLQDVPLGKITVAQICTTATVSRSTFYAHYYDKYAVLETVVAAETERFADLLKARFAAGQVVDVQATVGPVFKWLLATPQVTQTLLRIHEPRADFGANLQAILTAQFEHFLDEHADKTKLTIPLNYLATQYSSWVMTELTYQLNHQTTAGLLAFSQRVQSELFKMAGITLT